MTASSTSQRFWPWLLAWLLLTVYFVTPPREVFNETLDPSNYATYAYFIAHGFQWGVQVMPMPGPLGFVLFGYCYSGELYGARLIGDLLLCAAFSAMLLNLCRRSREGVLRWTWLGVMILVVPFVDDLLLDAAVLLSAICLLIARPEKPDRWAYLGAVVLAFVALIKGTHVMMCAAVFGTVALLGILERRPTRFIRPAIAFLAAFLVFWTLAGQDVRHIPAYLSATAQLASGYSLTMGVEEEHPFFFRTGITLAAGLALVLAWTGYFGLRTLRSTAILFFISLLAFLKWKHGYVRADGHVYIFFASAAIIAITAWFIGFSSLAASADRGPATAVPPRWRVRAGLGLVTLVTTFAVIGCVQFWLGRFVAVVETAPARVASHLDYLLRPSQLQAKLDAELQQVRRAADLPQVRNEVGNAPIDFFGNEEGIILLNNLNYQPRPMGGGTFNVVNTWLQRHNAAYILSPETAPRWQMLKLEPFDDRLPSGDDGLALRAILDCYAPVLMQREYLLLKRTGDRAPTAEPRFISTVNATAGEPIPVPEAAPGEMVLFSLHAPFNLYGRLRSFLYRPPVLEGRFVTDHYRSGKSYVLKPAILQDPMILSPLVEDTNDVLELYTAGSGNVVRSLTLRPASGFAMEALSVTFYSARRPPQPPGIDIEEFHTYQQHALYNREPVQIVTQDTGIRELSDEPISLVHAPGSITWDLQPQDQQVIFSYGLVPKAYLDGGTTNGVEFNVEVIWPPNEGRVLFKRLLQPVSVEQDRGMQRARVFLPPYEAGAQLRIRTDPGPYGDGAWDQSYITRVNIKQGPLVAEQFHGLGVVPADQRLPHEAVTVVGDQSVFLLHAPNEVALNVPSSARTLRARIGLLPTAYSEGGKSNGVEFTVLSQLAGGEMQKLWSRFLHPLQRPEDRGMLDIAVPLPELPANSRLIVKTDVGPNGDRGWDQSYIANVRFD